jgi:flagellar L-ring protein precursor FlgH
MPICYLLFFVFVLAGCSSVGLENSKYDSALVKAMPVFDYEDRPKTGSIFMDQSSSRSFGFRRRFELGDVITVVLDESTQAQRSSGINTTKEVTNSPLSQLQKVFGNTLPTNSSRENRIKRGLKGLDFSDLSRSDKGVGIADQAASLSGAIAVIVTHLLPNGSMFIEGKKELVLSEGSEEIFISGIITPKDIQPDNTVLSSRIAQANITYRGQGDLADVATANWGSKFFNKIWPF